MNNTELHNAIAQESQRAFFQANGYLGPFSLENNSSVKDLRQAIEREQQQLPNRLFTPVWQKLSSSRKAHVLSRLVFEVSTETSILNNLTYLLGPNLLLWIGSVLCREPGSAGVSWHVDQVNAEVNGVHLSVAISDMTLSTGCLQVILGSHKYQLSTRDLIQMAKRQECDVNNAESMRSLADRLHPENAPHQIVSIEMQAGQYFFTKGGLWHNVVPNRTDEQRMSLVCRYMSPEINSQELLGKSLPCILVRGKDNYKVNKLYRPPSRIWQNNMLINEIINAWKLGTLSF